MTNLNNLLELLQKAQIDFIIVGGYSATLHGSSLVTQDLDICIEFNSEQIERLREILKDYHPIHRMHPKKLSFLTHPEDTSNLKNLYLKTDLGTLDLLGLVGGVGTFQDLKTNALQITLNNLPCSIISIDDLIKAKEFMGRPKDLMTIQELKCLKR